MFTTPAGKNNVLLTVESENPRFVGNLIIPYGIDVSVDIPIGELSFEIDDDIHLRTEVYSRIGGEQSIVVEQSGAYIIRERDLFIFVIGNEVISQWSGVFGDETIAICSEDGHDFTMTDINGEITTPELLLIPEGSDDSYATVPSDTNLPYQ